jgi:hypothetical protein
MERLMKIKVGSRLFFPLPQAVLRVTFEAFPHGTSTSIPSTSTVPYFTTHSILRCRVPISGVQVITAALRPTLTHSNYSNSLALCRISDHSYPRDTRGIRYPLEIPQHSHALARTATVENTLERAPSFDHHHNPCANSPQSPTSPSSQPSSLHGLQAAVAATGNSSNTSLTSCEPRFYPSAATTSSSFVQTAVAFPIDDPGASSVTVPDSAAMTVASRKKVRMMTAPSVSAVVVARGTDGIESLLQPLSSFPTAGITPPLATPAAAAAARRPTHCARHSVGAPVLAPKDACAFLRRDSNPNPSSLGLRPSPGRVTCAAIACSTGGTGPMCRGGAFQKTAELVGR